VNREWGLPDSDLLSEMEMVSVMRLKHSLGLDVLSQPEFWERIVARQLGGEPTAHKALHDVDVPIWGRPCRAEVKYSRAFRSVYKPIRGTDWTRLVFKWALPRGQGGKEGVDACILVGRDVDGLLFCWVVPATTIASTCASITMTAPSNRKAGTHSIWDRWAVPWDAMLPAFADRCHNTYDAANRRAGIRARQRAQRAVGDLLEPRP
jgi:hypothetical protein